MIRTIYVTKYGLIRDIFSIKAEVFNEDIVEERWAVPLEGNDTFFEMEFAFTMGEAQAIVNQMKLDRIAGLEGELLRLQR